MMEAKMAYCIECDDDKEYAVKSERVEVEIRGTRFSYVELSAYCPDCGEELYVPEINDKNVEAQENAYREACNLITVEQIQKIQDKYGLSAKPLSKLMGYGDITISRYMLGQLPSKKHSDELLKVLASHKEMRKKLDENGSKITEIAYKKCKAAIDRLDQLYSDEKIDVIARYFIYKSVDITALALQKLLYYAQSFYKAFTQHELFKNRCQAWALGPVYPDIYYKYREFGFNPIDNPLDNFVDDIQQLTTEETAFLDTIINAFGVYSGRILSKMTHEERPWLVARGDLRPNDRSVTELNPSVIDDYFQEVLRNFKISDPSKIKSYSEHMFKKVAA